MPSIVAAAPSIIAMRLGPPPRTLQSIAEELGCTRERVRQVLEIAAEDGMVSRESLAEIKKEMRLLCKEVLSGLV